MSEFMIWQSMLIRFQRKQNDGLNSGDTPNLLFIMLKFFLLFIFLFLIPSSHAEERLGKGSLTPAKPRVQEAKPLNPLTPQQVERVKAFKQLIKDVDTKSLQQTIDDVSAMKDPSLELELQEAIARTYADIVQEHKVTEQKTKEWLWSVIKINMAYLQLGGQKDESTNGLHVIIRQKLREYLPSDILRQPGFLYKLE